MATRASSRPVRQCYVTLTSPLRQTLLTTNLILDSLKKKHMGRHSGKYDSAACKAITGTWGSLLGVEEKFYERTTVRAALADEEKLHEGGEERREPPPKVLLVGPTTHSEEERNVWQTIRDFWHALTGTADELSFVHEDYRGWLYTDHVPGNAEVLTLWHAADIKQRKTLFVQLSPVGYTEVGDTAVAHYYYMWEFNLTDGTRRRETGRFSTVLTKRENSWMVLADHGGPLPY